MISLLDGASCRHGHWLLPCGGYPQAFAALLAAPLLASGAPARRWREWLLVLAPLPVLSSPHQPPEGSPQVHYRYLLRLAEGPAAARICCWRRYGDGIGWQRRCGPMALELFISHFASNASLPSVPNRPYAAQLQAVPAKVAPTDIATVESIEAVQLLLHSPQVPTPQSQLLNPQFQLLNPQSRQPASPATAL